MSPPRHVRPARAFPLALLLLSLVASAARGQQAPTATVTGQVRQVETSTPVAGAVVSLPALRLTTRTDSAGRFVLRGVPEGMHQWTIVALGYVAVSQQMEVRDGDNFTVGLMPRPVVLGGVTVNARDVDRMLVRRRNAAREPVELLTRDDLLRSGEPNAERLVTSRANIRPCGDTECVWYRGRYVPTILYIDDERARGGTLELATYQPSELYAIEIWAGGAEVRVFTNLYMEKVATGRARLQPRNRLAP